MIKILDLGTNQVTDVTSGPDDTHPRFSPDGSKILFARGLPVDSEVWTVSPDGSNPEKLIDCPGAREPSYTDDGQSILFVSDEGLMLANADGSSATVVPTPKLSFPNNAEITGRIDRLTGPDPECTLAYQNIHADLEAGNFRSRGTVYETFATGANIRGQVVGYDSDGTMWLWNGPGSTNHVNLGQGKAHAINDSGVITGVKKFAVPDPLNPPNTILVDHAFRWIPDTPNGLTGTFQDVGTLMPENPFATSVGWDINNASVVVGRSVSAQGEVPFIASSAMSALPGGQGLAFRINDGGDAAGVLTDTGWKATFWPNGGGAIDLHALVGGWTSEATGINDVGQVVVTSFDGGGSWTGFLWQSGQQPIQVRGSTSPQYNPRGVSNDGIVVGVPSIEIVACWPGAYQEGQDIAPLIVGAPTQKSHGYFVSSFKVADFTHNHWIAGWITASDGRFKAFALEPQGGFHPP